jgi:hypothetical protein
MTAARVTPKKSNETPLCPRRDQQSPILLFLPYASHRHLPAFARDKLKPKSEIETGHLSQSLGHKRIEKISTEHFGYASIFSIRFCSKILRHLAGLNFGFRAKTAKSRPLAGFGNG